MAYAGQEVAACLPCGRELAWAGIGRLIIVDPDSVEASNLERMHGAPGLAKRSLAQIQLRIARREYRYLHKARAQWWLE